MRAFSDKGSHLITEPSVHSQAQVAYIAQVSGPHAVESVLFWHDVLNRFRNTCPYSALLLWQYGLFLENSPV